MTGFPKRIVYVDDEQSVRQLVRDALERRVPDIILVTCGGGQELMSRLRELQPDLILLDLKMPQMSGPDVLDALRKKPEGARVPVIFITAKTKVEMAGDYRNLGVIGVIHKPFDAPNLHAEIGRFWEDYLKETGRDSEVPENSVGGEIVQ